MLNSLRLNKRKWWKCSVILWKSVCYLFHKLSDIRLLMIKLRDTTSPNIIHYSSWKVNFNPIWINSVSSNSFSRQKYSWNFVFIPRWPLCFRLLTNDKDNIYSEWKKQTINLRDSLYVSPLSRKKAEDLTGTDHHILNFHSPWWFLRYLAPVILMNVDFNPQVRQQLMILATL